MKQTLIKVDEKSFLCYELIWLRIKCEMAWEMSDCLIIFKERKIVDNILLLLLIFDSVKTHRGWLGGSKSGT